MPLIGYSVQILAITLNCSIHPLIHNVICESAAYNFCSTSSGKFLLPLIRWLLSCFIRCFFIQSACLGTQTTFASQTTILISTIRLYGTESANLRLIIFCSISLIKFYRRWFADYAPTIKCFLYSTGLPWCTDIFASQTSLIISNIRLYGTEICESAAYNFL